MVDNVEEEDVEEEETCPCCGGDGCCVECSGSGEGYDPDGVFVVCDDCSGSGYCSECGGDGMIY